MFADLLSFHDGQRRICSKPRYPVSDVNLSKILYFQFTAKRFVHDIFNFHYSCIGVFLMHNSACFSLVCPIFNKYFTPLVFLRNELLRQITKDPQSQNANLSRSPDKRVVPKAINKMT